MTSLGLVVFGLLGAVLPVLGTRTVAGRRCAMALGLVIASAVVAVAFVASGPPGLGQDDLVLLASVLALSVTAAGLALILTRWTPFSTQTRMILAVLAAGAVVWFFFGTGYSTP